MPTLPRYYQPSDKAAPAWAALFISPAVPQHPSSQVASPKWPVPTIHPTPTTDITAAVLNHLAADEPAAIDRLIDWLRIP